jgi:peptide/nickel transport system substrate-binding protein
VEQEPFIFLINKNSLSAVSTMVRGAVPVILSPQTFWNAERLTVAAK